MGKRWLNCCLVVIVTLGLTLYARPAAAADIAAPGHWWRTGSMTQARHLHTATLLSDGRVLVTGGSATPEWDPSYLASAEVYDPATGAWSPTGPMSLPRGRHTATLLLDGRVLVVGGNGDPASQVSAEVYDPATGTWTTTSPPNVGRTMHTATRMADGRVLVAGGLGATGVLTSTEIYDPGTGTWSSTAAMAAERHIHTATLLQDGRVLVVGGKDATMALVSAELYDPATATWSTAGSLARARWQHTATLLTDGRVLVAGGDGAAGAYLYPEVFDPDVPPGGGWAPAGTMLMGHSVHTATLMAGGRVLVAGGGSYTGAPNAEAYDPAGGTWSLVDAMTTTRSYHTATRLADGRVLVAGGYCDADVSATAELFTVHVPAEPWTATGSMTTARNLHTATLLPDGRVLVAGGSASTGGNPPYLPTAELYDPASGTWTATAPMSLPRGGHTATLLPNGRVLVAGGLGDPGAKTSAEIYDPTTETWSSTGPLNFGHALHTATLLHDGRVLIVAGLALDADRTTAEIFNPDTGTWSQTGRLNTGRDSHTATLLPDGHVLVTGGIGDATFLASTEIWSPGTGTWSTVDDLSTGRFAHTATLLPDGRVFVAGGLDYTGALDSAEVYDSAAPPGSKWSSAGAMASPRGFHTATLLAGGQILVAGGTLDPGVIADAEVYDLAAGTWSATGTMGSARKLHTATLLADGRVLVAGGDDGSAGLPGAELYTPTAPAGSWTATGSMSTPRAGHAATLLPNGLVLVAGGGATEEPPYFSSAELYDPATGTWRSTGPMNVARAVAAAILLRDGRVLVVGGAADSPLVCEIYDPATESWTTTGSLNHERLFHTATLLRDGRVLVAGGMGASGILASAELYDPATGTWTQTGAMSDTRHEHTATLLTDGRVLVAAGYDADGVRLTSAELYDPATGTWSTAGDMNEGRWEHTATLLRDGRVLVVGGWGSMNQWVDAELFDPAAPQGSAWSPAGTLSPGRANHTAALLSDGRVLVAGGYTDAGLALTTEAYDPATGEWSQGAPMITQHTYYQTTTLLPDGRVLMVGGHDGTTFFADAEVYDSSQPSWTPTGAMAGSRGDHTATLLPDGRVLAGGGMRQVAGWIDLDSAETYDPQSGTWTPAAAMTSPRSGHSATLLPGGQVLVAGGKNGVLLASAELYDLAAGSWSPTGSMGTDRAQHTATLLADGKVLVAGGDGWAGALADTEVYDPGSGVWLPTGPMNVARTFHTATLLPDGTVLVAGGYNAGLGWLDSVEVYDPATGVWSLVAPMAQARARHTATLLPDGTLLVVGGLGDGEAFVTAEVYDPASGTWGATGSLAYARGAHEAVLLRDGRVLVAGGFDPATGFRPSAEVYDPATGTWRLDTSSSLAVEGHALTALADGRALASGGLNASSAVASAYVYDRGLGYDPAWRATIDTLPATLLPGDPLTVTGSGFRGYGFTEASGGSTRNSATNYPVVEFRRVDNGQVHWLLPDAGQPFSDTLFTSLPITGVAAGPYLVTVFVNGIDSVSAMTHILAQASNHPPQIAPIDAKTVDELVTLSFVVTAADPDPGDTLTFALEPGAPAGAGIDPATGEFAWTPDEAQGPGVYTVTVVVTDSGAPPLSDAAPFTVTVHEVNLPPVTAGDAYTTTEDTPLDVAAPGVLGNDLDPDLPAQVLTATIASDPLSGTLVLRVDGSLVYTPGIDFSGTGVFSYYVSDGAYTATAAVTLTVAPVGDPPAIDPIGAQVVDELVTLSFVVTAADPDPGDTLTFALEPGAPAGAAIGPATGEFAWTPDEAQGPGVYTVTVVVTDSGTPALGDAELFTITVNEVNLPPVAAGDAYTVGHGTLLTVTAPGVLGNDSDPDLPLQVLTVTLQTGPLHGDLALAIDGGFVYTPSLSFSGVDTFTYTLSDGELSVVAVVTLTVSAPDRHTIYLPLVIRSGG